MIAKASITIDAPAAKVWHALIDPASIKQYLFGTNAESEWTEGSAIRWKGEWQGKAYEDKGEIRKMDPHQLLQYTHFSPLAGLPDKPENYHTVTIGLVERDAQTDVSLSQDNNPTDEAREHSEKNWLVMLEGLKKYVEAH